MLQLRNEKEMIGLQNQYSCRYLEGSGKVGLNLMIDATNQCQLNCRYCYYGEKGNKLLSVKKVMAASKNIAELFSGRLGNVNFHYMGGEPLLAWAEIVELNELAKINFSSLKIPFKWSMTSNLVALDERKTDHMIKEKAGIHCSLDGPRDIHDRNRPFRNGAGSFDKVMNAVPLALRVTPNDTARVTVCPEDAGRLAEIADEILGRGFKIVGLFPAYENSWDDRAVSDWQKGIADAFAFARKKYGKEKTVSTIIKPTARDRKNKTFSYCGAGKGLWALGTDGMLYFCHHMTNRPELAIIDASVSSVEDIRNAIENSALPPNTQEPPVQCENCEAADFCNGGCWSDNLITNNAAETPVKNSCALKIATVQALGETMYIEPKMGNGREIKACRYCTDTCQSCVECNTSCESSCQDSCEHCENCYSGCQTNCESSCQNCDTCEDCQSRCEHFCQSSCEKNCENCEGSCEECACCASHDCCDRGD